MLQVITLRRWRAFLKLKNMQGTGCLWCYSQFMKVRAHRRLCSSSVNIYSIRIEHFNTLRKHSVWLLFVMFGLWRYCKMPARFLEPQLLLLACGWRNASVWINHILQYYLCIAKRQRLVVWHYLNSPQPQSEIFLSCGKKIKNKTNNVGLFNIWLKRFWCFMNTYNEVVRHVCLPRVVLSFLIWGEWLSVLLWYLTYPKVLWDCHALSAVFKWCFYLLNSKEVLLTRELNCVYKHCSSKPCS